MENLPLTSNIRNDLLIKPSASYQAVKQVINKNWKKNCFFIIESECSATFLVQHNYFIFNTFVPISITFINTFVFQFLIFFVVFYHCLVLNVFFE